MKWGLILWVPGIPLEQRDRCDLVKAFKLQSTLDQSMFYHTACTSFWITKRQAISTDTSFETKMMLKSGAIEIIFKSHEPIQSYLLNGQA